MQSIIPPKLQAGDEVRVVAPSRSLSMIGEEVQTIAKKRFSDLGLQLSFGEHVCESDEFVSSSIASRVEDLHDAFADKKVKAVISVIGGFNSNQLLRFINWEIIKHNPKIFCGYSDITALCNSIFERTGLVTYYGPHYSSFGQKNYFDYTLEHFRKCFMNDASFTVEPSEQWSDDAWYADQADRHLSNNDGYLVLHEGEARGTIIGGNLCTFNLLQGTEYMPSLDGSVLFLEDDYESVPHTFDRDLQSLIHQPGFSGVKGLVIGRFQKSSNMTNALLSQIIESKKELKNLPVIAGTDFGHSDPKITFPIGGTVKISSVKDHSIIEILAH